MQSAEYLGLSGQCHVANLIEKNRAAIAAFEFADALIGRSGEGPLLVAEKFALNQVLGNGSTVDRDVRLLDTETVLVNGARNEFFTSTTLACDHHRNVAGSNLTDHFEHLLHRGRAADDAPFNILLRHRRSRFFLACFIQIRGRGNGRLGQREDLFQVEGLHDVVKRTELHCLNRGLRSAIGRHQNDHGVGVDATQMLQGFHATHAPHTIIQKNDMGTVLLGHSESFLPAGGFKHFILPT